MSFKRRCRVGLAVVLALVFVVGCGKDDGPTVAATTVVDTAKAVEATTAEGLDLSKLSTFVVSSEDLHDGVWDTVITNTRNGQNRSPQLKWEPVEGAACYAVFMVDTTVRNWVHWKSLEVTETSLDAGWAPKSQYVGPYPPSGTHEYEIFVLALKHKVEKVNINFDTSNPRILVAAQDIDGEDGNILSYGHLTGTYTYGD